MPYHSQFGQDRYLAEKVFAGRREGFFVDVGAYDGVEMSNTLAFEEDLGWSGICVEANDSLYARLADNRSCATVHTCLYSGEMEVRFLEADGSETWHPAMSGVSSCFNSALPAGCGGKTVVKRTRTLEQVLDEHGAPSRIDFLSIDTEGTEYLILKDFPFGRYRFTAITIEHNNHPEQVRLQRELLGRHGYVRVRTYGPDDFWVSSDHPRALPLLAQRLASEAVRFPVLAVREVGRLARRVGRVSARPEGLTGWLKGRLKGRVRSILGRLGYELRRVGSSAPRDPWLVQRSLAGEKARVVLDIGGHYGAVARRYSELFPHATVWSFEPFSHSFEQLRARTADVERIRPVCLAAAEESGRRRFFDNPMSGTNSLYPFSEEFPSLYPDLPTAGTEVEVATERLDAFCEREALGFVDLLKLDVQGAELLALQGCARMLEQGRIGVIYTEVMFTPHYKGAPRFCEIAAFLEEKGYRLFDLFVTAHSPSGQVLQGDAIFVPAAKPE